MAYEENGTEIGGQMKRSTEAVVEIETGFWAKFFGIPLYALLLSVPVALIIPAIGFGITFSLPLINVGVVFTTLPLTYIISTIALTIIGWLGELGYISQ